MSSLGVIQLNARTPTLSTGVRLFIDGTLGVADRFMSMPARHKFCEDWTPQRIQARAARVGPNVANFAACSAAS